MPPLLLLLLLRFREPPSSSRLQLLVRHTAQADIKGSPTSSQARLLIHPCFLCVRLLLYSCPAGLCWSGPTSGV